MIYIDNIAFSSDKNYRRILNALLNSKLITG